MTVNTLEPWINSSELEQLNKVIESTYVTEGPLTKEFEAILKDFTGSKHAIAMANGTLAIFAALKALGLGPGDEVIVPNLTFVATANAVILAGATPIFCDIRCNNFAIDLKHSENLITKNTKAIIPVHLYGKTANMNAINQFAKKHNLYVVEDAAQGVGVFFEGKHTGTMSNVGILSFYGNKTITTGEGGVCLTNDDELAKKLYQLKNHGRLKKGTFIHETIGFNLSFSDLQAAVGVAQLKKLKKIIKRRFDIFHLYKSFFDGEVQLVEYNEKNGEMPWVNSIRIPEPANLENYLREEGIVARRFFYPLDLQPCYKGTNYIKEGYHRSHCVYDNHLSIPSSYTLTEENIKFISEKILQYLNKKENQNNIFKCKFNCTDALLP
jgi:perosamine synthetase